jgi:hypothetical protein
LHSDCRRAPIRRQQAGRGSISRARTCIIACSARAPHVLARTWLPIYLHTSAMHLTMCVHTHTYAYRCPLARARIKLPFTPSFITMLTGTGSTYTHTTSRSAWPQNAHTPTHLQLLQQAVQELLAVLLAAVTPALISRRHSLQKGPRTYSTATPPSTSCSVTT